MSESEIKMSPKIVRTDKERERVSQTSYQKEYTKKFCLYARRGRTQL